jgi:hypothetical protein
MAMWLIINNIIFYIYEGSIVKMRKIVTGLLTLSLTLCAGLTSFAAETTQHKPPLHADSANVTVTIKPTAIKYKVTVDWESLDFTYTFGNYDPDTHTYSSESKWDKTSANIVVENHSNADITVDANFEKDTEIMTDDTKSITNDELDVNANLTVDGGIAATVLESAPIHLKENTDVDSATISVELENQQPNEILNTNNKVIDKVKVVFNR